MPAWRLIQAAQLRFRLVAKVVSLVPIRFKILPCIFSHEDIDALLAEDPVPE